MREKNDKSLRGSAGQYFVAGELSRRNLIAAITLGHCPNTDILCSNIRGDRSVHIQVKTFVPGAAGCAVGMKGELEFAEFAQSFFWVLAGIPQKNSDENPIYYVIPSADMAKNVRECFEKWASMPGHDRQNKFRKVFLPPKKNRNGWELSSYENRWDLIEQQLA